MQKKLNPREKKFVAEYLFDMNGTAAALRVGFAPKNAPARAVEYLRRPHVREAVEAGLRRIEAHSTVSAVRTLEEVARIAFADPRAAFDKDGRLLALHEMDEDTARAVASVKMTIRPGKDGGEPTVTQELKFWDKGRAAETILKTIGKIKEHEQTNVAINALPAQTMEQEALARLQAKLCEVLGGQSGETAAKGKSKAKRGEQADG